MKVRVKGKSVDVAAASCPKLKCFQLGQDKGHFVQGRGYVSYHKSSLYVCMERHVRGCPRIGVCADCRSVITPSYLGKCGWCGSANLEMD